MRHYALLTALLCAAFITGTSDGRSLGTTETTLRPPAVPLVAVDPYFSIWSETDNLNESWPRHWSGSTQGMSGMIRVDNTPYRFMGVLPKEIDVCTQTSVQVTPTRSIYKFTAGPVNLDVTFTTPALPSDLDVYSWPITFVAMTAKSRDGNTHKVDLYLDTTAEICVNDTGSDIQWGRLRAGALDVLKIGAAEQRPLRRAGDAIRIDWGFLYLATPRGMNDESVIGAHNPVRKAFADSGTLPGVDDARSPRPANDDYPVMACSWRGEAGKTAFEKHAILAYDDIYSFEFLQRRVKPYWRLKHANAGELLADAERRYDELTSQCVAFDKDLCADAAEVAGRQYADLVALTYRECVAAHKLATDFDGTPLHFPKENSSNGCVGTVDVIYPAAPFFTLLSPALLQAQLEPVMQYAGSARWRHAYAPHDLGTWPLANGQIYGGGESSDDNQMPVEESANMVIMLDALAHAQKSPDYAAKHIKLLRKWTDYLAANGGDPENQLCTDDFAGHLARNVNLSAKAIVAIACYADLCSQLGQAEEAKTYRDKADAMVKTWMEMAADGDHYMLAFRNPGTWSLKYNLVWDKILGLKLFPQSVYDKELSWYLSKANKYGVPLDSRKVYTKLDWLVWTAAMEDARDGVEKFIAPIYLWANETSSRVPLTDWYNTTDGLANGGFRARSVVGGIYAPMIRNTSIWQKWTKAAAPPPVK